MGIQIVDVQGKLDHINLPPPTFTMDNSSNSSLSPSCGPPMTPTEEYNSRSSQPFSAFYLHPTTRTSFEQHKSESKIHIRAQEQDLEAASSTFPSSEVARDSEVWPCKQQLKKRALNVKRSRGCSPLSGLTQTQKLWVKLLVALVVIGAAVGIGIGISKAVGAGVWKNSNSQKKIGGGSRWYRAKHRYELQRWVLQPWKTESWTADRLFSHNSVMILCLRSLCHGCRHAFHTLEELMSLPSFACSSSYGPECAVISTYFPWLDGWSWKYPAAFRRRDGVPFSFTHFGRYFCWFSLIAAMTESALNVHTNGGFGLFCGYWSAAWGLLNCEWIIVRNTGGSSSFIC